ncbi:calcium-binding protein [Paracoccus pacificus]|uniref:Calcium-binding protein n=1 Tax=Paracoccus pacificus TaxID=1463598 RepID=A0ABW4R8Q8_9RHOB
MANYTGTSGNDTIYGSGGNDSIAGLAGDDFLAGGMANDRIDGGAGNDVIYGDLPMYRGYGGSDTILGGAGNDRIIDRIGRNLLNGGDGDDTISSDGANSTINGGAGVNDIYDNGGYSLINGNGGTGEVRTIGRGSTIDGGGAGRGLEVDVDAFGPDILKIDMREGGWGTPMGDDALVLRNFGGFIYLTVDVARQTVILGNNSSYKIDLVTNSDNRIILGSGDDNITDLRTFDVDDPWGNNNISMGGGEDFIQTNLGGDTISMGADDDYVRALVYAGAGSVDGGAGLDLISLSRIGGTGLSIDLRSTGAPIAGAARIAGFENLTFNGEVNQTLKIFGGDDAVMLRFGSDAPASGTLRGGFGGGNDTLLATGAVADFGTGAGNDLISIDQTIGRIDGQGGDDTFDIRWTAGSNLLPPATRLVGGAGNDVFNAVATTPEPLKQVIMHGGTGDDVFASTNWGARIVGGSGNDTLDGSNRNDYLDGGDDVDAVRYLDTVNHTIDLAITTAQNTGEGSDVILNIENVAAGAGADLISGNAGANLVWSGDGNDSIGGRAGNDGINAGAGDDVLDGNTGNDVLTGGAGADRFLFRPGDGVDQIRDFQDNIDKIHTFYTQEQVVAAVNNATRDSLGWHVKLGQGDQWIIAGDMDIQNILNDIVYM